MLVRPKKRIWPSVIRVARSNVARHVPGLKNGSRPSNTSINAKAPNRRSAIAGIAGTAKTASTGAVGSDYFRGAAGAAGAAAPPPRMARKKSLLVSSTITSPLLRKVAR